MSGISSSNTSHLLIFEPRVEGHHLTYLRYITEDLLSAGHKLTLALDPRAESQAKIRTVLGDRLSQVKVHAAFGANERGVESIDTLAALARCQRNVNADQIFLPSLDEIASDIFRRAAFGKYPPQELRGRLSGIYFRPRMLEGRPWSFNQWFKRIGFERMLKQGWFKRILLCDEFLHSETKQKYPDASLEFLPDPYPENFLSSAPEARRELGLPLDKRIFLFYGGPYRRKGLHLVVDAMQQIDPASEIFLLCVGEQPPGSGLTRKIEAMEKSGRARLVSRYVSDEEEKLSFAAADFVLLPYIGHFGSSGVLARAAGAHKIVIASNEELIGRRVREHKLGLVFTSGNAAALAETMVNAAQMSMAQREVSEKSAASWSMTCSRAAFRRCIQQVVATSEI